MKKMQILVIVSLFMSIICYADAEASLYKTTSASKSYTQQITKQAKHDKTSVVIKKQPQPKLNLSLTKDIKAKVRKDDKMQQQDKIQTVLPNLFSQSLGEATFGISGSLIKSVDVKEKGDVDGARIQFKFKQ